MAYNRRTNQYQLAFTVSKEMHEYVMDYLNKLNVVNQSEFLREVLKYHIENDQQKEIVKPWHKKFEDHNAYGGINSVDNIKQE